MRQAVLALTISLAAAAAAAAEPKFNVDFDIGWGGCYRPMEWTPVQIDIHHKLKKPLGGVLRIHAQQDSMTNMTIKRPVVLTPGLPLRAPMVTKLAFGANDLSVNLMDQDGRNRWSKRYDLLGGYGARRPSTILGPGEMLIGVSGRTAFGLMELPKRSRARRHNEQGGVFVRSKLPRLLPWDWTGYASLDLLVLYDPDWDQMNVHQSRAVVRWVQNGGRLLIVLGSRPLPADRPITQMLPFAIGKARRVELPASMLRDWGCRSGRKKLTSTVTCWSLAPPAGGAPGAVQVDVGGQSQTLLATEQVGFGRVGVMTFDPSAVGGQQAENLAHFWVAMFTPVLDPGRIVYSQSASSRDEDLSWRYDPGPAAGPANQIMEHLLGIPELRPLSIWWVIALLAALAILLGPVDYLVLKSIGRLPLTWVTSTFCIVAFSVGAYYGVQMVRAGTLQVRVVTVLDGVAGDANAWSTSYTGIFAPASDDYRLVDREGKLLAGEQWFSAVSPNTDEMWYGGMDAATREVYCVQRDGGNIPDSLPISIWSMQCLVNESVVPAMPFTAEVTRTADTLTVTVTNTSDNAIKGGYVMFGKRSTLALGAVPPRATKQFSGRLVRGRQWDRYLGKSFGDDEQTLEICEVGMFVPGCIRRTRALCAYLKRGAAVVCMEFDQPRVPVEVARRKCTYDHVQLARLVVMPKEGAGE